MKIGLIGAGRLGICLALLIEKAGYEVIASDTRSDYIRNLQLKKYGGTEPGVSDLLSTSNNISFTVLNDRVIDECDVIFTLVATPSLEDGSYDVSAVDDVVSDILKFGWENKNSLTGKSFIVGCTTNPGDCDRFQEKLSEVGMNVYYNPEFIAQGSIVKDLQTADMVLIGGKDDCYDKDQSKDKIWTSALLAEIYHKIQVTEPSIHYMSTKAAELTKIALNCFLTTKISYANMIGEVLALSKMESEIDTVLKAIGSDSRIGNKYLGFGFGFGGPCFPRDNRAFAAYAKSVGVEHNIGTTTDNFNEAHAGFIKEYVLYNNHDKKPFCFRYLTYKPETDILTESQQYRLCLDLLNEGCKVYCVDDTLKEQLDDRIIFTAAPLEDVYWIDL